MASVVKAKQIKPARLKEKEMRLELLNELRKVAKDIRKDFEKTTSTWKHKPKFEEVISLAGGGPSVLVGTDDEIYRYVNEGTKKHIIKPKKAKILRFPGTYSAKTRPGVIGSSAGGPSGDDVFAHAVMHPGTKARNFEKAISDKWDKTYKRRMEEAMKRAVEKSGHAMK